MRRIAPLHSFVAAGAAAFLLLGSLTFCHCAPQAEVSVCEGCCTPAGGAKLVGSGECCTVVGGSMPASLTVQDEAVLNANPTRAFVDPLALPRWTTAFAASHSRTASRPPTILRI